MRRAMSSLLSADDARYRTGRRARTASAKDAVFSCWLTCSTCEPKFFNRISLLYKYWFIPAAYAIERSVPRKTRRSKPDSAPEIWSWCFAINCCTAFLLSVEGVLFWNAPHPTRAETPQFWLRLRRAVLVKRRNRRTGEPF